MNRRQLMALAGATAAAAALPRFAASKDSAAATHIVPYTREAFDAAVASGRPLLLDTYASW